MLPHPYRHRGGAPLPRRQSSVSVPSGLARNVDRMPDSTAALLNRLIGEDPTAPAEILRVAPRSASPTLLVAAALLESDPRLLARAGACARSSRDRQLVALAEAFLDGEDDRLDVLVRDHLSDHPDNLLASWIAGRPAQRSTPEGSAS